MIEAVISDLSKRMDGAITALKSEFNGLRTGRASVDLLGPVVVDAYGSKMPLNQVGNVSVSDTRSLTISVWDTGLVQATEKAIRESGLGLNPSTEGNVIRINLPELNEETRKDLIKVARKYAESARVSVRNVRRDGMDTVKKSDDVSEDDARNYNEEIQKVTDAAVKVVDDALTAKEADIMQV
ncbi:MAG: ribosome recycling factor [Alphaproteobacteria bacterium]|jgi:ribosome recycling factor